MVDAAHDEGERDLDVLKFETRQLSNDFRARKPGGEQIHLADSQPATAGRPSNLSGSDVMRHGRSTVIDPTASRDFGPPPTKEARPIAEAGL